MIAQSLAEAWHGQLRDRSGGTMAAEPEAGAAWSGLSLDGSAALLSTVAHELRAPLAALVTASELLVEDFGSLDEQQAFNMVATVHRGSLWLQSLVDNLLCAATMRDGHFRIRREPMQLLDIVAEIRPVVEPLLKHKNQRLQVSASGPDCNVAADRRRIGQVLVNLIVNAGKFAGSGTAVDVRLAARDNGVRVAVMDRGPGIPEAAARRLFEPFYQVAPDGSSLKGVGLGLAIVKSIVDAHDGRVGVENRRGGGACFWFDIPTAS